MIPNNIIKVLNLSSTRVLDLWLSQVRRSRMPGRVKSAMDWMLTRVLFVWSAPRMHPQRLPSLLLKVSTCLDGLAIFRLPNPRWGKALNRRQRIAAKLVSLTSPPERASCSAPENAQVNLELLESLRICRARRRVILARLGLNDFVRSWRVTLTPNRYCAKRGFGLAGSGLA